MVRESKIDLESILTRWEKECETDVNNIDTNDFTEASEELMIIRMIYRYRIEALRDVELISDEELDKLDDYFSDLALHKFEHVKQKIKNKQHTALKEYLESGKTLSSIDAFGFDWGQCGFVR